jgi:dienelactone hydrolase
MVARLWAILVVVFLALTSIAQSKPAERVVDLTSADGTKLKATFFAAAAPGPGVLLLHQCNKDRKIWDGLGRQLAAAGVNVLTFDLRNFGESQGAPYDSLQPQQAQASAQKWPADVDAAFAYLIAQPGVKRDVIGLGGASCGVNNAVQAARRHPGVKSMVLLAGSTGLEGRNFLRKSEVPVLYGFADDDEYPASLLPTKWLYALTPNPGKTLVRYATGGHGAEIFAVHPEFEGTVKDWFVTTLVKTPGRAPVPKQKPDLPKEIEVLNLLDQPGGAAKVSDMLAAARKQDANAKLFPEDVVNVIGYQQMLAGDTKTATEVLRLNAEAYPNSANVYDSLSDAYIAAGQKDLALANAKRALDMLKTDTTTPQRLRDGIKTSCEQKLRELGGKAE